MDNFVIRQTNDLDELEQDIQTWYRLPFNLRMRSNDECIRQYGMNMLDLYNSIKSRILGAHSKEETDEDNITIVGESFEFNTIDPYLLAKSKEIQSSPYIVILDPDIISKTELDDKFSMFNCLNSKNRRLSNDFSVNLWGYNVYNMYDILLSRIETEKPDRDNIVKLDDSDEQTRLETVIKPLYNIYNSAMIHHNEYDKTIVKANILETVDDNNVNAYAMLQEFVSFTLDPDDASFDESILPSYMPYLLPDECIENMPLKEESYFKQLSYTKPLDRQKLYWNPFIPISEDSIGMARKRYSRYFNSCRIVDIRGFKKYYTEQDDIEIPDKNADPIYIIFGYNKNKSIFDNNVDYVKSGICLDDNFKTIYTITGMESSFNGFKLESLKEYEYITIVAIFVTEKAKTAIKDHILKSINHEISIDDITTPYTVILSKLQNKFSPDAMRIVYKQYIDFLLRISNINTFEFSINANNVYKLYEGLASELDLYNIEQLLTFILSSNTTARVLEGFCKEYETSNSIMDIKTYLDYNSLLCIH